MRVNKLIIAFSKESPQAEAFKGDSPVEAASKDSSQASRTEAIDLNECPLSEVTVSLVASQAGLRNLRNLRKGQVVCVS